MTLTDLLAGLAVLSLSVILTAATVRTSFNAAELIRECTQEMNESHQQISERIETCIICEAEADTSPMN